ncbi:MULTISPECIES: M35 family metallo-endopeptidase [unclassified Variovorax]|uniref:M35 family metallo-endopeptidase n=1 Tax=unclassified Variovorax TaxID=663243 RepID=UPI003F46DE9C
MSHIQISILNLEILGMMRKLIVVGDPPASGGAVLPYGGPMSDVFGKCLALIGGRAYCEGCNSVGIIAKAGGPRRGWFHSAEMALEGDVVVCHCPVPPPLVSKLQHPPTYDDALAGAVSDFSPSFTALPGWFAGNSTTVAASKKLVDDLVEHPPEATQTENICSNMTNKQFASKVMALRDLAVDLVEKRVKDLIVWGKPEQERAMRWFGQNDEGLRHHLDAGLKACIRVLKGLTEANFVRYSEEAIRNVGCIPSGYGGRVAAEVCKPDIKTRTIGIGFEFCELPDISYRIDSKLATIIHEVTHFDDVFSSNDTVYQMGQSLKLLASNTNAARVNADSIVGYVLYGD